MIRPRSAICPPKPASASKSGSPARIAVRTTLRVTMRVPASVASQPTRPTSALTRQSAAKTSVVSRPVEHRRRAAAPRWKARRTRSTNTVTQSQLTTRSSPRTFGDASRHPLHLLPLALYLVLRAPLSPQRYASSQIQKLPSGTKPTTCLRCISSSCRGEPQLRSARAADVAASETKSLHRIL
eukprot:Mycagemm_TRINITY_DN8080_c0_g1::TRINITY_DN8080_c0_g1_i1::g.4500::m.4500 type:complete len:183 gc:universal TRINITY_DN8080_c0_g1_i1:197-745(+)